MDSSLANIRAVDRESRIRVDANYINDTAIFISELEQTSVSTPVGIKRLEGEAGMVARTINELAIRRFLELHEMNKSVRERSIETYVSQ
ncbi:MAG TPA: hypothetical protein PLK77_00085 [Pyrinomonadaceae bacterium]|nr:hypothetical protein [Pyrinomonadaceae bacterium]